MKIGLIDVDGHNFPNLALMKISAWHKAKGDTVEWCIPLAYYDIVYQAKVFDETYSLDIDWIPQADKFIIGGTGYYRKSKNDGYEIFWENEWLNVGENTEMRVGTPQGRYFYHYTLPDEIEHIYPDYSIYGELTANTAYGFLSRGCPRGCGFCIVAGKEGRKSYKVADLSEFWRGQKFIQILDPNILACRDHPDLLQQLIDSKAYVNFNQGLDIRFTTEANIPLLNQVKKKEIHFAWDNPKDDLLPYFERYKALATKKYNGAYAMVYCLVNYGSTMEENLHRIYTLRDLGYQPYVMVYDKPNAPLEVKKLQRWCNNKFIFKKVTRFEDYDANVKNPKKEVHNNG